MIIKPADDKTTFLEALRKKSLDPTLSPAERANASRNLMRWTAGLRAEKEAAYELDFYYASAVNWAVIHDLRLEVDGRVAQIDHLVINRLLQIAVLETKSFSEGVGLNEHGEFVQFYQGRPKGIASPVAQNERHISVLNCLLRQNSSILPTRLGIPMRPELAGLVVVSKTARISRPKAPRPETQCLLKIDQLQERLDKDFEKGNILKLVSSETLKAFATALASFHKPKAPEEVSMPEPQPEQGTAAVSTPVKPVTPSTPAKQDTVSAPTEPPESKTKLVCATCNTGVPYAVAKFCWVNKARFGGKVYCREHQQ